MKQVIMELPKLVKNPLSNIHKFLSNKGIKLLQNMLMLNPSNRVKAFAALRSSYFDNIQKSNYSTLSADEEYERIKNDNDLDFNYDLIKKKTINNKNTEFTPFSLSDEELYNALKNKKQYQQQQQLLQQQQQKKHQIIKENPDNYQIIERNIEEDYQERCQIIENQNVDAFQYHELIQGNQKSLDVECEKQLSSQISKHQQSQNSNNNINNNDNDTNDTNDKFDDDANNNNTKRSRIQSKETEQSNQNLNKISQENKVEALINTKDDTNNLSYIIKTNSNIKFSKANNEDALSESAILKNNEFEDEEKINEEEIFNSTDEVEKLENPNKPKNHYNQGFQENKNNDGIIESFNTKENETLTQHHQLLNDTNTKDKHVHETISNISKENKIHEGQNELTKKPENEDVKINDKKEKKRKKEHQDRIENHKKRKIKHNNDDKGSKEESFDSTSDSSEDETTYYPTRKRKGKFPKNKDFNSDPQFIGNYQAMYEHQMNNIFNGMKEINNFGQVQPILYPVPTLPPPPTIYPIVNYHQQPLSSSNTTTVPLLNFKQPPYSWITPIISPPLPQLYCPVYSSTNLPDLPKLKKESKKKHKKSKSSHKLKAGTSTANTQDTTNLEKEEKDIEIVKSKLDSTKSIKEKDKKQRKSKKQQHHHHHHHKKHTNSSNFISNLSNEMNVSNINSSIVPPTYLQSYINPPWFPSHYQNRYSFPVTAAPLNTLVMNPELPSQLSSNSHSKKKKKKSKHTV
ncbi:hypothetical protein BCR36DRAFT_67137 [Piromyces finnis]|uniref:Protein kinase domain-containing protein n=1 Tax=Piromyces finnis TaxID=1754191 RepID=A0A1Y1V7J8_9FUNG|nr:hypothetical protein BCR36DRAFT_67137 [Piromyces finnis]|eukprot:ORX49266.1 hypothetical protein BCR36DRAFT_67137 [Piromyces finnis]